MKNRNPSSPILSVMVLLLVAPLLSRAEPGAASPTYSSASATQPASGPANGAPATTAPGASVPVPKHTVAYTVAAGDSLTSIAQKFNTTRKKLRALNDLTATKLKPGQVLLVPFTKKSKPTTSALTAKATHHDCLMAQPVQDFDIPASTFASCPVPTRDDEADSAAPAPVAVEKPASIAKPVSPAELTESAPERFAPIAPAPRPMGIPESSGGAASHFARTVPGYSAGRTDSRPAFSPPPTRPAGRIFNHGPGPIAGASTPMNDWANRFLQAARALGNEGIEYDEDWRPPGESRAWAMDCSNTSRYIYKVTTGIQLPRTASDQYYYLHLQGKAWDVPQTTDGFADGGFLRRNLRPGDLLFWENTYRPERQPPITHVMVFLGANDRGQWIMAGSQTSRGGEHNRRNGGPDIYIFRPSQPCGGYTTWLGLVHHRGRFCAFGRPLEADPAKLAVAAND